MGIQLATPPPESAALVTSAVVSVSQTQSDAAAKINQSPDPSQLNSALPHPVYQLDVADIQQGKNLDSARRVGWRFLILDGTRTVAAIELTYGYDRLEFSQMETGPFVEATREALRILEDTPSVQDGMYEFRLLRAPGVYVMAVWLKDLQGDKDIVQPLAPIPGSSGRGGASLMENQSSFVASMMPLADQAMSFHGSHGESGGAPIPSNPPITPPPMPLPPSQSSVPMPGLPAVPAVNRNQFIRNYAALVARTWVDPSFLQLLRSDPVTTLAHAGIPTVAGAEVVVVETVITGVGKVEDALDEWIKGNVTGRYCLWLPIKPDNVNLPTGPGGSAAGGGDACCSCCPCCCCT